MNEKLTPALRKARYEDISEMQRIFADTIAAVCKDDYSPEQLRVWISGIHNHHRWEKMVREQYCVVALEGERLIGFGSLEGGSYVDFLYVHKDYLRDGVASVLIGELLAEAARQRTLVVSAHVSKTARAFFERHGFAVIRENTKVVHGVEIKNFAMSRQGHSGTTHRKFV